MRAGHSTSNVLVVSLNNLAWLLKEKHHADGVVIDELSKAAGKQAAPLRTKRYGSKLKWRVGLTATPVSQNFEKLFGMTRIIDQGAALGTSKQRYMQKYFVPDYMGYNWTIREGAAQGILGLISPLVHLMADTKEVDLPPVTYHEIQFNMPPATRHVYNDMKNHMVAESKGKTVDAANQAVKSGKLRQISCGFMYAPDGTRVILDQSRMNAADQWWRALDGRPGLIFYEFVEDGLRLKSWMPDNITLAQIQSMSHGVDGLQHRFSDVLFYMPVWSRDAMEQAVGRVWRQGQTKAVDVTTLMCDNSVDQIASSRVAGNAKWMDLLRQHIKGS